MGVTVRIPTPLRRMTNGQAKLEMDESTLSVMIENLEASYPGFKERLIDENGDLRYFVNIYLNGEDVRFLQGLDTSTSSGDEIILSKSSRSGRYVPTASPSLWPSATPPTASTPCGCWKNPEAVPRLYPRIRWLAGLNCWPKPRVYLPKPPEG